ncbi:MAG: hypothetical protein KKD18_03865 [Nanoarchaeota archaeon]|nr:hypothetical protein [Nanoarchaeota archaeon]
MADTVHIRCGICGRWFRSTKVILGSCLPWSPLGHEFSRECSGPDGSITLIKFTVINNRNDICLECGLGLADLFWDEVHRKVKEGKGEVIPCTDGDLH